ncbi:MAG: HupE/UreJ family protein [Acidobacteriota bacterium]
MTIHLQPWVFLLASLPLFAHDIAGDVKVQAYLKPQAQQMHVVLRVPLKAMRDIEFPQRGPGYLDVEKAQPLLRDAVTMWLISAIQLYENSTLTPPPTLVAVKASLESDRSFVSYTDALEHVTAPTPSIGDVPTGQVMLDVALDYPIQSQQSEFSIRPKLERLGITVVTVLWFLPPEGTVRAFEYVGDAGLVRLDPSWYQAAMTFVRLGFFHILNGTDHLLFLFCVVIPFRKFRPLLIAVTSFTVAHSITLIASAFNLAPGALWFPPLIETLIATSIVYMALENIVGTTGVSHRWMITFAFGLVHGFGFSFALHETLQFAGTHLLTSLLAFNVGVELGQILVLLILVPALALLFRHIVSERIGTIILSALIAHTAWHWLWDRWDILKKFW